jgi:hypothetical protein
MPALARPAITSITDNTATAIAANTHDGRTRIRRHFLR